MFRHPLLELTHQYKNMARNIQEKFINLALVLSLFLVLGSYALWFLIEPLFHKFNIFSVFFIGFILAIYFFLFLLSQHTIEKEKNILLQKINIFLKDETLISKLKLASHFVLLKHMKMGEILDFTSSINIIEHLITHEKDYTDLTLLSYSNDMLENMKKDLINERIKNFNSFN